jgi:hypothetical protein
MVRKRASEGIFWDPYKGEIESEKLEAVDAVINLAGQSVAERWTPEKKRLIMESRVKGTTLLADTIARLSEKPRVFVCASAIGYYGERGDEILTEDSAPGNNYLASVCVAWERCAAAAVDAGVRVVSLRFGIVLSTTGGAFPRMLAPFQMGAGGRLGHGRQYMSWIALDDAIGAVEFVLTNDAISVPANVVAPEPVTNNEFTQVLGQVLHRPTLMPVPVRMAHLAFGNEMADQVLLASARVLPRKLSAAGFSFRFPKLDAALRHLISSHT